MPHPHTQENHLQISVLQKVWKGMLDRVLILDFYVDEPACFGVPPYLSPYVRYAAGALVCGGLPESGIDYMTVDEWRSLDSPRLSEYDAIFIVMGSTVPGKYLGGKIGTVADLYRLLEAEKLQKRSRKSPLILVGGPVRFASKEIQSQIHSMGGILVRGDLELYAEELARDGVSGHRNWENSRLNHKRSYEDVDRYSMAGAFITQKHPNFPYLILEMETYRGCTRDVFCSFCTEAFYGRPVFRPLKGILDEFAELGGMGNRFFRLGRQADIMTYLPRMEEFKNSFPRPDPKQLEALYSGVSKRVPKLELLHLDNMNPGLIATYPEESAEILKIISEFNTEGDTAAMGLESVDPRVIAANDLKCSPEEAYFAIEMVNKFGSNRVNGIPKILPGLNFIGGLQDEDENTFKKNFEFLKNVMDNGLMIRRINIRQVVEYENTKIAHSKKDGSSRKRIENRFLYYRDKIRAEIDEPMLKKTFPSGSKLRNVILEKQTDTYYMGRQLGSYPITVKIPKWKQEKQLFREPIDVMVTGHQGRSITALPYPLPVNQLTDLGWRELPGIGKNQASDTLLKGPFHDVQEFKTKCPEIYDTIQKHSLPIEIS